MKPRHSAAVAAVGWYVMVPIVQKAKPVESSTPPDGISAKASKSKRGRLQYISFHAHVDPKAPLSKWMVVYYSDSKRDCQALLKKLMSRVKRNPDPLGVQDEKESTKWREMNQRLAANAKCVASDDLRLKGNREIRRLQHLTPQARARIFERLERDLEGKEQNRK